MKNIKRTTIICIIIGILILVGCENNDGEIEITTEGGTLEDYNKEPDDSQLKYYNTLEEAIFANKFTEQEHVTNIKKIAKVLRKDNDCLVLFVTEEDKDDYLVAYKLKMKENNEKTYYSTPCYAEMFIWYTEKILMKKLGALQEKVKLDITQNNFMGSYDIDNDKVAWGLWKDDTIKKLKVNGKRPTGIIELKLDGDKAFLWYYENLNINLKKDIKITAD